MIAFIDRTHTELCIKLLSHDSLQDALCNTLHFSLCRCTLERLDLPCSLSPWRSINHAPERPKKTAAESRSSLLHIILFSLMMPPLFFFTRSDTS